VEKFVNKADLGGEGQMEYEGFIRSMLKRWNEISLVMFFGDIEKEFKFHD
jgi:hypothetical protein